MRIRFGIQTRSQSINRTRSDVIGADTRTLPLISKTNYATEVYYKRALLEVQREGTQIFMNEDVKYVEDVMDSPNLVKVDMGHIVIGIFKDRAEEVRPEIVSILKGFREKGKIFNIMYLSDLRKVGFDANEAFALVALLGNYGLVTREQAQTRNMRFMLTEVGIKELSGNTRVKTGLVNRKSF
ncbi:MAG: hypothetical protein KGH71_02430 [Candidatus Micrarchaeota archaeon]|nr:hypothetical protein [Candidatus Micrarchaeota archaeon]